MVVAPKHTSTMEHLQEPQLKVLLWSSQSPNLDSCRQTLLGKTGGKALQQELEDFKPL